MNFRVSHETLYRYSAPASLSANLVCLTPRSCSLQQCLSSTLIVEPAPEHIDRSEDYYGNNVNYFRLEQPHTSCSITIQSDIQTKDQQVELPPSPLLSELPNLMLSQLQADNLIAHDCLLSSPMISLTMEVDDLVNTLKHESSTVLEFAESLMHMVYQEFTYDPTFSTVITPMSEVLRARKGVCQDFAHLAIAVLRRVGIPARYVSGYLETLPPPGQPKLKGADASHAWYSVFVPEFGWIDFDPTNNKRPDHQYITTAWGRDYSDVSPLRGVVYGGGAHKLSVSVDVERIENTLVAL